MRYLSKIFIRFHKIHMALAALVLTFTVILFSDDWAFAKKIEPQKSALKPYVSKSKMNAQIQPAAKSKVAKKTPPKQNLEEQNDAEEDSVDESASSGEASTSSKAESHSSSKSPRVLNDAWYVLQSGSTPWGYLHEFIEERDDQIHYRSEMTKQERGTTYTEFVGAIAKTDLTPVSFNISKSGQGATEIVDGVFIKNPGKPGGNMRITISGAKAARINRGISPDTLLETFFPLWVRRNWDKLKPGSKHGVRLLSEDAGSAGFNVQQSRFSVKGLDSAKKCIRLNVTFRQDTYDWCINENGGMVDMTVSGKIYVKRVSGETEAKAFLKE